VDCGAISSLQEKENRGILREKGFFPNGRRLSYSEEEPPSKTGRPSPSREKRERGHAGQHPGNIVRRMDDRVEEARCVGLLSGDGPEARNEGAGRRARGRKADREAKKAKTNSTMTVGHGTIKGWRLGYEKKKKGFIGEGKEISGGVHILLEKRGEVGEGSTHFKGMYLVRC